MVPGATLSCADTQLWDACLLLSIGKLKRLAEGSAGSTLKAAAVQVGTGTQ